MKKLLPALLAFIVLTSKGQTLTQVFNEPKAGDIDFEYLLDTTAFTSGMPIGVTGTACVWNYTSFVTSSLTSIAYVSPTAVPSSTTYTGCTAVEQDGLFNTFIKSVTSPSTQTEIMGLTFTFGAANFTNTAIAARYPISYSYSLTDNISGIFTSTITNGTCSGSITTKADGVGTLNLPQGQSFTNVLRLKSVQSITFYTSIIPVGSLKQTIYNYYHSSQKFPILSVTYQSFGTTGSSPTLSSYANGNANIFVSVPDIKAKEAVRMSFFPNPAKNEFYIDIANTDGKNCGLTIYNDHGQLVRSVALGNTLSIHEKINTADLAPGIYFLRATAGNNTAAGKLVVE